MTRRPLIAATLAVAAAALLTACATASPSTAPTASPGASSSAAVDPQFTPRAGFIDDGRELAVVLWGGCPPVAGTVENQGQHVTVTLADPGDVMCIEDMGPRPMLVGLPASVDSAKDVTVTIRSYDPDVAQQEVSVPGVAGLTAGDAGTDYLPSATWLGEDLDGESALIGILTWGSSSCAPAVHGVTTTDAQTATVTLRVADAERACTMDMAPRLVVASVAGVDRDVALTVDVDGVESTISVIG